MNKPSPNRFLSLSIIATTTAMLCACATTSNQSATTNDVPKPKSGKTETQPNPEKNTKFFNIPADHPIAHIYFDDVLLRPERDGKIIYKSNGKPFPSIDLNRLHNSTSIGIDNKGIYSLKIKTITDKTKTHKATAIEGLLINKNAKPALPANFTEYKVLSVPLAFPHFNTPSGALYSADIFGRSSNSRANIIGILYKKVNELDFNALPRGKAQYQGIAIGFEEFKTNFDIGSITLNADFDSKNISGNINRADGIQIELQQTSITNDNGKAKYSGTAKATVSNQPKTGTYEGNFFGHHLSKRASDTVGKVTFGPPVKYLSSGFGAQRK